MAKKIALFSDGTANSSAKAEKTNVWRLFQALDQTGPTQLAKYDDGVGTSSNKYLAAIGGAFGWGLKRNVIDLYKFVCANFEAGDEIYGFGFSRGAFTIRVLVGLIATEGLVTFRSEEELSRNAASAYRHYRTVCFTSWSPIVWLMRRLRDLLILARDKVRGHELYCEVAKSTLAAGRTNIPIQFLGLWDTVDAYGVPILELKRGIDWLLWPMYFDNLRLSALVKGACHALSLDDERTTFHPLLWDEVAEAEMVADKTVPAGRITQVWFAGVHSNVGGGYPEDQLSLVTLDWMMNQALANGLRLVPSAVDDVSHAKSPYARLYDSRAGLAAYYRYSPRQIPVSQAADNLKIRPIIHGSVVMRMGYGSDRYAPITLRREFWVLASDGELLPMEGFPQTLQLDATKKLKRAAAPSPTADATRIATEKAELQKAIHLLGRPETEAVGLVWDTVWWRRLVYFLTMALTTLLIAFPFIGNGLTSVLRKSIQSIPWGGPALDARLYGTLTQFDAASRGFVADAVDALQGLIPGYLERWTGALKEHPIEFALLVGGVLLCLYIGRFLQMRIRDRAVFAWHKDLKQGYIDWLLESEKGARNTLGLALAIVAVLLIAAFTFGWGLMTRLQLAVLAIVLAVLLLWRGVSAARVAKALKADAALRTLPSTFSLRLARRLRTNRQLTAAYRWIANYPIPILFALGLLAAGAWVANRVIFDLASASGAFCKSTILAQRADDEKLGSRDGFSTDNLCWASGLVLK